jgi:hypothetical protein
VRPQRTGDDIGAAVIEVTSDDRREVNRANRSRHMTTNGAGSYGGKVAFVTGAGSGIGRATALAFARGRRRGGRRRVGARTTALW